ncbi:MAG: hypothetical protein EAZ80_03955 [Runella slithyformis]|nr:MAG: hypothetical protein EAZ80_03955 [Runella slithyformis]
MKNIKALLGLLCFCLGIFSTSNAQNIVKIEYYIDTDPGFGVATDVPITAATPINNLNVSVPMTGLTDGFHQFFARAKDANGAWSMVSSHQFLKVTPTNPPAVTTPNIVKVEYYLDTDPGFGVATDIPISAGTPIDNLSINLPMTGLTDGFHQFFARAKDANGAWSMVANHQFLKTTFVITPAATIPNVVKAEYFIDTDPGFDGGVNIPLMPGTPITNLSATIDISVLTLGTHKVFIRIKDDLGAWSMVNTQTITIANNAMLVGTVPTGFCRNAAFNVPFIANGTFSAGNVFTAQLSNASGSFTSGVTTLGTLTSTTSGIISATIPNAIALGTGYKIRVIPSNPALTNVDEEAFSVLSVCPPPCGTIVILQSTADDYSTGTILKQANASTGVITATNKITGNANVTYKSGKSIILEPGFKVDSGTVFKTEFGGCN